ncbi:GNAT family N-acetyltransferase [Streptomyces venezuelae]|uniref:GNAT family N-acetyltransferase n=1 Tax=Streptomyces venezuelae TaxID=54571 RepID=UPI00123D3B6A|nr:GNAT family N-acetyltransferase [Streptomyces venezuelae]QES14632.1 GNAT family N-acetyltransferase [Streptomyces venezuelae]
MITWSMRPARAEDVEAVAELRAVVMRDDLVRLGVYDEHQVRQRLRNRFRAEHTWIVEVDGAFAGCAALVPNAEVGDQGHGPDHRDTEGFWLEHFYLAPDTQGRGFGTAVLRELLDRADAAGLPVRLQSLRGSAAVRLYEREGFTVETETPHDLWMIREPRTRTAAALSSPR